MRRILALAGLLLGGLTSQNGVAPAAVSAATTNEALCAFDGDVTLPLRGEFPVGGYAMEPSGKVAHTFKWYWSNVVFPISLAPSMTLGDVERAMVPQFRQLCEGQQATFFQGKFTVEDCTAYAWHFLTEWIARACKFQEDTLAQQQQPVTPAGESGSGAEPKASEVSAEPPTAGIYDVRVSNGTREHVLQFLRSQRSASSSFTVLDVGATMGGWSYPVVDAVVDANDPGSVAQPGVLTAAQLESYDLAATVDILGAPGTRHGLEQDRVRVFKANVNFESSWQPVLDHVARHGKFSFAICTHTLEDLALPQVTLDMLGRVAAQGFVAVPTKYREFSFVEAHWHGYAHHRWVGSVRHGAFTLYPKLPWTEHASDLEALGDNDPSLSDLSFFWKGAPVYRVANDDYMGPTSGHVLGHLDELLWDDLDVLRIAEKKKKKQK